MARPETATLWRPGLGDLVRVRENGLVGEIVGITDILTPAWYTVALISPEPCAGPQAMMCALVMREPRVTYLIDELEPRRAGRRRIRARRGRPRPSGRARRGQAASCGCYGRICPHSSLAKWATPGISKVAEQRTAS